MIDATSATNLSPFDRLMLLLVGAQKSGKSRFACTARKPILNYDFDKRRASIAGQPGVYIITLSDDPHSGMQPSAYNDYLRTLYVLETKGTLRALGEDIKAPDWKDWPDLPPKTTVVDSVQSIAAATNAYCLYTNKDIRRSIKIGGSEVFFNNGWDAVNSEMATVKNAIERMVALPFKPDCILVFHESDEEHPNSTPEKRVYTGKKSLYPARYGGIFNTTWFNEVWRVTREGNATIPTIQVLPDYRFTASSNLDFSKLKPEQINPKDGPNIERLISMVTAK
jgi:AAA domain